MAERGQLIIRLRVDGTVQAETKRIHGDACVPFAAILEDLCDAEAIDSDYTSDYYAVTQTVEASAEVQERDNT
jgi:hypothetical protein